MNDKILSIVDARKTFVSKNRRTIALHGISFEVKAVSALPYWVPQGQVSQLSYELFLD